MVKPPVSVVVPAYNEERYIRPCLEALKQQTYTDFELIVVDNNCTDKTAEIARSFGATVIREKKQGMIPARDRGFRKARGELILRTDADTVVPQTWIGSFVEGFQNNPGAVALTGSFVSPTPKIPDMFFRMYTHVYFFVHHMLTGHGNLHGPNMAVRKSALEQITPCTDDTRVHEDVDLACHLAPMGKIRYVPEISIPYSLRRIRKRPVHTAVEYTRRYLRTVFTHHFLGKTKNRKP